MTDKIITHPQSKEYDEGWERTFRRHDEQTRPTDPAPPDDDEPSENDMEESDG